MFVMHADDTSRVKNICIYTMYTHYIMMCTMYRYQTTFAMFTDTDQHYKREVVHCTKVLDT